MMTKAHRYMKLIHQGMGNTYSTVGIGKYPRSPRPPTVNSGAFARECRAYFTVNFPVDSRQKKKEVKKNEQKENEKERECRMRTFDDSIVFFCFFLKE